MSTCLNCNGTGIVITCWDDLCANSDHCIHGDGEEPCPECDGEGDIPDEEEWGDDEKWEWADIRYDRSRGT